MLWKIKIAYFNKNGRCNCHKNISDNNYYMNKNLTKTLYGYSILIF